MGIKKYPLTNLSNECNLKTEIIVIKVLSACLPQAGICLQTENKIANFVQFYEVSRLASLIKLNY